VIILGINLENFYLNTPLPNYKYMRLCLDIIPEEIVLAYNLHDIVKPDGWVYIEIRKGMYGLPQVGILANILLEQQLSNKGVLLVPTHTRTVASHLVDHHLLPRH
jgi:hypothetical protein